MAHKLYTHTQYNCCTHPHDQNGTKKFFASHGNSIMPLRNANRAEISKHIFRSPNWVAETRQDHLQHSFKSGTLRLIEVVVFANSPLAYTHTNIKDCPKSQFIQTRNFQNFFLPWKRKKAKTTTKKHNLLHSLTFFVAFPLLFCFDVCVLFPYIFRFVCRNWSVSTYDRC